MKPTIKAAAEERSIGVITGISIGVVSLCVSLSFHQLTQTAAVFNLQIKNWQTELVCKPVFCAVLFCAFDKTLCSELFTRSQLSLFLTTLYNSTLSIAKVLEGSQHTPIRSHKNTKA